MHLRVYKCLISFYNDEHEIVLNQYNIIIILNFWFEKSCSLNDNEKFRYNNNYYILLFIQI